MVSQKRSARRLELRKYIFQNTENCTDTFGWHHWGSVQQGCSHPNVALFCLTTLWASLADCSRLFKLWSGQETIFINLTSLSFLVFTVSLGFPPGEPLAGLASLQLGSVGVLPLPHGQAEDLWSLSGLWAPWSCGYHVPATELSVQLCGAMRLEWTPRTGTPLCRGTGVAAGRELRSLEPSEAPGTWQHESSPVPPVLHRTGSCGKHGIFRIWGSLKRGGRGPEAAVAAATGPEFQEGRGAG